MSNAIPTILRQYNARDLMHNDYYKVLEVIDVEAWIKDCVVCKYLAEEMVVDEFLDEYGEDFYLNIVEAYGKVWVCMSQYGDGINSVHVDFDGEVIGSSYGIPSLDLDGKCYYVGDEPTHMGYMDKFESINQWVWKGFELDCKSKTFPISKKSMERFLEVRKDYLLEQAEKEK